MMNFFLLVVNVVGGALITWHAWIGMPDNNMTEKFIVTAYCGVAAFISSLDRLEKMP